MNTFLPFKEFITSAKILDDLRLRKQLQEVEMILNTLTEKSLGWKNHPAVTQWKGYENALRMYGAAVSDECKSRKFKGKVFDFPVSKTTFPIWLGDERYHRSMRSRLLFKGRVDSVCESVKKFVKVRSIKSWLKDRGYPDKNIFKLPDILRLEQFALENKIAIGPNYYKQFNWSEPDTIPYFWPTKNGY